jgi:hypothetical protein
MSGEDRAGAVLRASNEGLVARYTVKPWHRETMIQVLRWPCVLSFDT